MFAQFQQTFRCPCMRHKLESIKLLRTAADGAFRLSRRAYRQATDRLRWAQLLVAKA